MVAEFQEPGNVGHGVIFSTNDETCDIDQEVNCISMSNIVLKESEIDDV